MRYRWSAKFQPTFCSSWSAHKMHWIIEWQIIINYIRSTINCMLKHACFRYNVQFPTDRITGSPAEKIYEFIVYVAYHHTKLDGIAVFMYICLGVCAKIVCQMIAEVRHDTNSIWSWWIWTILIDIEYIRIGRVDNVMIKYQSPSNYRRHGSARGRTNWMTRH